MKKRGRMEENWPQSQFQIQMRPVEYFMPQFHGGKWA